jgi:hypothetical protein
MIEPSRIIWVSWINPSKSLGGGGAYSRSVRTAVAAVFPGVEIIPVSRDTDGRTGLVKKVTALSKLTSPVPYKVRNGFERSVAVQLQALCADRDDQLVVLDGGDTLVYRPYTGKNKTYHISHNVEYQLYGDRITNSRYPAEVLATVLQERKKYEAFELKHLSACDFSTFISPGDQFHFSAKLGREMPRHCVMLPSFSDKQHLRPRPTSQRRITFLADYNWGPNAQGISHFIDQCWHPEEGDVLQLVGKNSENFARADRSVVSFGWVADLDDVWKTSDVMIAPIYWGGGVNIKVCEAIYQGIPLVATPAAVRGLPRLAADAIEVVSDDQDWLPAIGRAATPSALASSAFSQGHAVHTVRRLFGITHAGEKAA